MKGKPATDQSAGPEREGASAVYAVRRGMEGSREHGMLYQSFATAAAND
jgi:hypothetical protein